MKKKSAAIILLYIFLTGFASAGESDTLHMRPATVGLMLKVLREEPLSMKIRAAEALGSARVAREDVLKELEKVAESDYPYARAAAVRALGRSRAKSTTEKIVKLLRDENEKVRTEACLALGEIGEQFDKLPFDDKAETVRLAALQVAGNSGDAGLGKTVAGRYKAEKDAGMQATVLASLAGLSPEKTPGVVREGLGATDPQIIANALACVEKMPENDAKEFGETVSRLLFAKSALVRQAAVQALVNFRKAEHEGALRKLCQDENYNVRIAAALALKNPEQEESVKTLSEMQGEENALARRAASVSLAALTDREKAEKLALAAIASDKTETRLEGLWLLGDMKSVAGFPGILKLAAQNVKDAKTDVRETVLVLWIINRTTYADGAELAVRCLRAADGSLRVHSAQALGVLKYEAGVAALEDALTSTASQMGEVFYTYTGKERENAIWALGEIGNGKTLDMMAELLTRGKPMDESGNLRMMRDILIAKKHEACVGVLKEMLAVIDSPEQASLTADVIEKLTGKRPDVKPYQPSKYYDTFFLEARP